MASIFDKIKGHIDRGVDRAGMFFNDPDVIRAMSVEQIEPDAPVGDAFKRYGAATLGGPGDIYSLIWKDLIGAESDLPGFRSLPTSETLQKRFGAPQGPEYMAVDFLASDPFSMLGKTIKGARQIIAGPKAKSVDSQKITAYHGSPHEFDVFDLSKIGTGEGAQAFGHGLYFTDTEDIAKFYKNLGLRAQNVKYKGTPIKFLSDNRDYEVEDAIQANVRDRILGGKFNTQEAIDSVVHQIEQTIENSYDLSQPLDRVDRENYAGLVQELNYAKTLKADDFSYNPGKTYKVQLQATLDEMIDYDLPLIEQPKILEKIEKAHTDDPSFRRALPSDFFSLVELDKGVDGRRLYQILAKELGSDKLASEKLNQIGIKGVKFLDSNTRNTFGSKLLNVKKDANNKFRAKVVLDDPNRQTGLGGSGRTITTSQPFKTEKEAREWADKTSKEASRNYVVFDDKLIDILKVYGLLGGVGLGTLLGTSVDRSSNNQI